MPERAIEEYRIVDEPFYLPVDHEVDLFEAAHSARLPVILKGPTGCGKTRFVEYMAWALKRPLVTLACNEDMTASDLVGRYLLDRKSTRLNSSHSQISYAVFCLKKKKKELILSTTQVHRDTKL